MSGMRITYTTASGEEKPVSKIDNTLPLLDNLQESGIDQPSSCMSGACGTCRTKVISGREHLQEDAFGMQLFPVEEDEILTCVCGIRQESVDDKNAVVELKAVE